MTDKELLEQSQKALGDFFKLSKLLFGDNAPMDVNEIEDDNELYPLFRGISDEMGLDWENMSHEDSNRVMLNVLADAFSRITPADDVKPVLTISFKKD